MAGSKSPESVLLLKMLLQAQEVHRMKSAQQGDSSDQGCSAGTSMGSRLLSRGIHRIKAAQQGTPSDQDCSAGKCIIGSRLLRRETRVEGFGFRV